MHNFCASAREVAADLHGVAQGAAEIRVALGDQHQLLLAQHFGIACLQPREGAAGGGRREELADLDAPGPDDRIGRREALDAAALGQRDAGVVERRVVGKGVVGIDGIGGEQSVTGVPVTIRT